VLTRGKHGNTLYYWVTFVTLATLMICTVGTIFHLFYVMRKYHHYEYKRHKCRIFTLFLIVFFSIWFSVRENFFSTVTKVINDTDAQFNLSNLAKA
jgi:hypothetical protein